MFTNEWSSTKSPVIPRITWCDVECGCNVGFVNRWQEGVNFPLVQLAGLDDRLSQDNFIRFLWILMFCGSLSTRKDRDRTFCFFVFLFVCLFFGLKSPWNWPFRSWSGHVSRHHYTPLATGWFCHEDYTHHKETQNDPFVRQILASTIQGEMCSWGKGEVGVTSEGTQVCTF